MRILLVSPFEPDGRKLRFLSPHLGCWRLKGYLEAKCQNWRVDVFDPTLDSSAIAFAYMKLFNFDVVGFSFTHETLEYDLSLVKAARLLLPNAAIIAGGVEAAFNPQIEELAPEIDHIIEGQGEKVLCTPPRMWQTKRVSGFLEKPDFTDSCRLFPFGKVPYHRYWENSRKQGVEELEARTVRLFTSNYCPMGCRFCSYTNFLEGPFIALSPEETFSHVRDAINVLAPRTIIFNDDCFTTNMDRVATFCAMLKDARGKVKGMKNTTFICESRCDTVDAELLADMKQAGFRMIGYGIESWSDAVLKAFNKNTTRERQRVAVKDTLTMGIVPFLNLILFPPMASMSDVKETVLETEAWMELGCEASLEPYVLALPGATIMTQGYEVRTKEVAISMLDGSRQMFQKDDVLVPRDEKVRELALKFYKEYPAKLEQVTSAKKFVPSRERSKVQLRLVKELAGW